MKSPTPITGTLTVVDKLLYTPVEVAHALGVSRSTVYELISAGVLPRSRSGAAGASPLRAFVATSRP